MNPNCRFCQLIADPSKKRIYEDDKVIALLEDSPCTFGHVILMPKEHYPIIENVPDFIISHIFKIANKISVALFESLNAQGTNILVNNGVAAGQESAHFMVNIIARREGDGLNFQWTPKQLNEEEMSTVELQLKEQTKSVGSFQKEKPAPIELKQGKETVSADEGGEEDYRIKQFLTKRP